MQVNSGIDTDANVILSEAGADKWNYGYDASADNFRIYNYTTGSTAMSITDAAGNVGIGTTSPAQKLTISDGTANVLLGSAVSEYGGIGFGSTLSTANYSLAGEGSNTLLNTPTGGFIQFNINNVEKMRMDSTGNVGIGTTAPGHKLTTVGTGNSNTGILGIDITGSGSFKWASSSIAPSLESGNNVIHMIGQAESTKNAGYIGFNYQGANSDNNFLTLGLFAADNLVNILGNGNVGIGTTAPGALLHLKSATPIMRLEDSDQSAPAVPYDIYANGLEFHIKEQANGRDILWSDITKTYISNSGLDTVTVYNGNVGIGTTAPGATLDVNGQIEATSFNYSTTETDTGKKWIDGSTVYRIVKTGTITTSGLTNIAIGATPDEVISIDGGFDMINYRIPPNHDLNQAGGYTVDVNVLGSNLEVRIGASWASYTTNNMPYYLVVEYTK